MDVAFTRLEPDSGERFQRLRHDLGVSSFGMNLIVLQPGQRGRIHTHDVQEEVFLVLEGALSLGLEGDERVLDVGELVRVGPGVRRQLVNRGAQRLVVLALGGSGDHAGRDGRAWEAWDADGPGRPPQEVPLPEDV
jgi:quercetin dioxygenase-like cupin family protein